PYGTIEPAFDLCRLAEAAGASFVARGTAANVRPLERLIKQGIQHKGFSFIEALHLASRAAAVCCTELGGTGRLLQPEEISCRPAGRRRS
ncbi:MAG: hypothetical protein IH973_05595, partial [Myxococcales bacterium]|nr:hypothetical protein [Myxococcales bacterium]